MMKRNLASSYYDAEKKFSYYFVLIDVFALGEGLRACDNSSEDEIAIWSMKENGDEKSWNKRICD